MTPVATRLPHPQPIAAPAGNAPSAPAIHVGESPRLVRLSKTNALSGGLIYGLGDTVAALLLDQFSPWRLLGMMCIGATLYAWEVPAAFRQIARVVHGKPFRSVRSVLLAMAYFNPLWIARHLFFLNLFSGQWDALNAGLLLTGAKSFGGNLPLPLVANYFIQNKVPLKRRFLVSSCFSAVMVVYYALSATWFK